MRRKGFTLIEMSMALSITALIIGAVTLLHTYVLRGLGTATSHFSNYRQVQMLIDSINEVAGQAQSYAIVSVNGVNCLKLIMPATCTDTNNNGLPDTCLPSRLTKHGVEEWGQGQRVWFYPGDSTGAPAYGGSPTVAIVSGDSTPTSSTALAGFATYGTGMSRFPNVDTMTLRAGKSDYFTVTISASSNNGELTERKPLGTQDNNLTDSYQLSRVIFLARWRQ